MLFKILGSDVKAKKFLKSLIPSTFVEFHSLLTEKLRLSVVI